MNFDVFTKKRSGFVRGLLDGALKKSRMESEILRTHALPINHADDDTDVSALYMQGQKMRELMEQTGITEESVLDYFVRGGTVEYLIVMLNRMSDQLKKKGTQGQHVQEYFQRGGTLEHLLRIVNTPRE